MAEIFLWLCIDELRLVMCLNLCECDYLNKGCHVDTAHSMAKSAGVNDQKILVEKSAMHRALSCLFLKEG